MVITSRILGSRKCISGAVYYYSIPGVNGQQTQVGTAVPSSSSPASSSDISSLLAQLAQDAQTLVPLLIAEESYTGAYRELPTYQVTANQVNFEIDLGFSARTFRLNTLYPIIIRLGSTQGDQIPLDYQNSPFELDDLPAGLAFSTVYVTNNNNFTVPLDIFAMG